MSLENQKHIETIFKSIYSKNLLLSQNMVPVTTGSRLRNFYELQLTCNTFIENLHTFM